MLDGVRGALGLHHHGSVALDDVHEFVGLAVGDAEERQRRLDLHVDGVEAVRVDREVFVGDGDVVADVARRAAGGLDRPRRDQEFVARGVRRVAVVLVNLRVALTLTFWNSRSTRMSTAPAIP